MFSLGLNNAELARDSDCTPTAVGNYVGGRVPRADHLQRIARRLGVSMEWLLTGKDPPASPVKDNTAAQRVDDLETKMESARRTLELLLKKLQD